MEQTLMEFPGREQYLKEIFQLFGNKSHCFPSSVIISGASGTGKTSSLLNLLDNLEISYAFVECIECYTSKMFYESVINSLSGHKLTENNNFESFASCDNAEDFIDTLNALDSSRPYLVILKNFDRLNGIENNILPIMMRFQNLVPAHNISCILIASQTKLNYIGMQGMIPTISIHCEQYGKIDLFEILTKQIGQLRKIMTEIIMEGNSDMELQQQKLTRLNELDKNFFGGYFNIFLDTFFTTCRNAKELVYLSNANFPIYCKPVIDGELDRNELRKLWKNMELPFKMAMNSIYCRLEQKPTVCICFILLLIYEYHFLLEIFLKIFLCF